MKRRSAILLPSAALLVAGGGLLGSSSPAEAANSVVFELGPSGGTGGLAFSDAPVPRGSRILQLQIHAGAAIDAVQTTLFLSDSGLKSFSQHGGAGGSLNVVNFSSGEFIRSISGKYGPHGE